HNPAPYNGFKIKDRYGRSAPPEVTREIEAHLNLSSSSPAVPGRGSMDSPPTTAGNDGIKTFDDRAAYESYLKSRLDWKLLRHFKASVVFDYLYGTAS